MKTVVTQERLGADASTTPGGWLVLAGLVFAILAIFVVRTMLANFGTPPRISEIFDLITVAASAGIIVWGHRSLTPSDWLIGVGVGLMIGVLLPFATLFSPYPFLGVVEDMWLQALIRGGFTAVAALGGLIIMRRDGPVQVRLACGEWKPALVGLGFGATIGLPLAVLNAYANAWTQNRSFVWQNPLAALLDALQPAVVEEIVYRLAFLGLMWMALRPTWPRRQAIWLAGCLALVVHTYSHFSDEFVHAPLMALAMGTLLALLWGVPHTVLALRRDLESAIGFHWVQDAVRFLGGL